MATTLQVDDWQYLQYLNLYLTWMALGTSSSPLLSLFPANTSTLSLLVLLLPQLALRLNGLCQRIHALINGRLTLILTVVHARDPAQGHNVRASDPQHGQLGQLLCVGISGHGMPQLLKGRRDRVHSSPLPGIGFNPSLPGHVLVVSLRGCCCLLVGLLLSTCQSCGGGAFRVLALRSFDTEIQCHCGGDEGTGRGAGLVDQWRRSADVLMRWSRIFRL